MKIFSTKLSGTVHGVASSMRTTTTRMITARTASTAAIANIIPFSAAFIRIQKSLTHAVYRVIQFLVASVGVTRKNDNNWRSRPARLVQSCTAEACHDVRPSTSLWED